MRKEETFHLRPTGWEQDPEEERFKLSTIDYLCACVYTSYAVFFKIDDDGIKPRVANLLKQGLEKTLSQTRHLCGTIEKDQHGGHSFVKKKDSTVQFVVQYLDNEADKDRYPCYAELERQHFVSKALGDIDLYSVAPMTCKCETLLKNGLQEYLCSEINTRKQREKKNKNTVARLLNGLTRYIT